VQPRSAIRFPQQLSLETSFAVPSRHRSENGKVDWGHPMAASDSERQVIGLRWRVTGD